MLSPGCLHLKKKQSKKSEQILTRNCTLAIFVSLLTSMEEILSCCGFSSVLLQEMPNSNILQFKT